MSISPQKPKKHYIDRDMLHAELDFCKRKNGLVLTRKAIDFFFKLAKNLIREYKGLSEDDTNDCVASSVQDMYKYWHNFKEANVVRLPIVGNFEDGEKLIFNINGYKTMIFEAKTKPTKPTEFGIGLTANVSMSNFKAVVFSFVAEQSFDLPSFYNNTPLFVSVDKIKGNLTIMDLANYNTMDRKSSLEIICAKKGADGAILDKFAKVESSIIDFNDPPNAFSYMTSVARSGILKALGKIKTSQHRDGNMVSINSINESANGLYSL